MIISGKKNTFKASVNGFSALKSILFLYILFISFLSGCKQSSDPLQDKKEKYSRASSSLFVSEINEIQKKKKDALNDFIDSLSPLDMVRELFIVNLEGNKVFHPVEKLEFLSLSPELEAWTFERKSGGESHYSGQDFSSQPLLPGGYIFFSYNLSDEIEEIMNFTDSIRAFYIKRGLVPPYLTLDQEGGFVNRLRTVNGPLPSSLRVSENLCLSQALDLYSLQARQMKALGFDMNLAPVSEVQNEQNEKFLNGRSFGSLENVLVYSRAFINGMQNNGISCVLKHFPGNTNLDPHTGLPELPYSYETLMQDTLPFREFASKNAVSASALLMSHARTRALDPDVPACLSEKWVKEIIRDNFSFDGIVFSDDIFMKALRDNGYPPEKAVLMAIKAGVDIIMISEKRFASSARVILEEMKNDSDFYKEVKRAVKHVFQYKIKAGLLTFERLTGSRDELFQNEGEEQTGGNNSFGQEQPAGGNNSFSQEQSAGGNNSFGQEQPAGGNNSFSQEQSAGGNNSFTQEQSAAWENLSAGQALESASSVKSRENLSAGEKNCLSYRLCPSNPYGKVLDRIVYFREAYKENVDFYIQHFK
ncbi:MAG: hypothetical protein K6E78_03750 [Treponema sp.]|nr:hypothetical protein [Treponema sp.]